MYFVDIPGVSHWPNFMMVWATKSISDTLVINSVFKSMPLTKKIFFVGFHFPNLIYATVAQVFCRSTSLYATVGQRSGLTPSSKQGGGGVPLFFFPFTCVKAQYCSCWQFSHYCVDLYLMTLFNMKRHFLTQSGWKGAEERMEGGKSDTPELFSAYPNARACGEVEFFHSPPPLISLPNIKCFEVKPAFLCPETHKILFFCTLPRIYLSSHHLIIYFFLFFCFFVFYRWKIT